MKISVKFPKGLPIPELKNRKIAQILNRFAAISVVHLKKEHRGRRDIDGNPIKRLKLSTVKAKKKRGIAKVPSRPLAETGEMIGGIHRHKKATAKDLESGLRVPKSRQKIATYHLEGKGSLPVRKFFGVGKKLEKKLNKYLGLHLSKIIAMHRKKMKLNK
tara:strand:- start:1242 stop:1721 length:480 start_codon:yes stop_codon:yes gene_type:complete